MWTLPRLIQIPIRRIERPLRDIVEAATLGNKSGQNPRWDGDRVGVVLGRTVVVEKANRTSGALFPLANRYGHVHTALDMVDDRVGMSNLSPRDRTHYWKGELADGEAFIVRRSSYRWGSPVVPDTVTIFLNQLWDCEDLRDQLEVARDAVLADPTAGIPADAYRIAREALPRAHGLFIALVRKERDLQRGEGHA